MKLRKSTNRGTLNKIHVVNEGELTSQQRRDFNSLRDMCFSHVDPVEAEECFYAESFSRLLAYDGVKLVGILRLFKREVVFDGEGVVLGGVGGVCVLPGSRRRGIGSRMVMEALKVLRNEFVDVTCLNADVSRNADKFYEALGFTMMNRPVSFEDVHGNLRHDTGTMFIPVCSNAIYDHIMNSSSTFHYGRGYW
jgi:GNAT superfamily N-acetyltransferase